MSVNRWKQHPLVRGLVFTSAVVVVGVVTFRLGFLWGQFDTLQEIIRLTSRNSAAIPAFQYTPAITLESVEDTRQQAIDYILGGVLPEDFPQVDGDRLIVTTLGSSSINTVFYPEEPNGAAVILHAGHEGSEQVHYQNARKYLNDAGYLVVMMDMPFLGANPAYHFFDAPHVGTVALSEHDQLMFIDQPLRVFIEPVIVVLNWLSQSYERIYMIGLSGGGWTTVLSAAIDQRIDASYPIAGSLPLGLRFNDWYRDSGDFEQLDPALYQQIATYEDLYILGAYQRRQIQIMNEFDPCCHVTTQYSIYELAIQEFLGHQGLFSVYIDQGQTQHTISRAILDFILADMERDLSNE